MVPSEDGGPSTELGGAPQEALALVSKASLSPAGANGFLHTSRPRGYDPLAISLLIGQVRRKNERAARNETQRLILRIQV